jgi:hypothetical protein
MSYCQELMGRQKIADNAPPLVLVDDAYLLASSSTRGLTRLQTLWHAATPLPGEY